MARGYPERTADVGKLTDLGRRELTVAAVQVSAASRPIVSVTIQNTEVQGNNVLVGDHIQQSLIVAGGASYTVRAADAKSGREDTLPIRDDLLRELRAWRRESGDPKPTERVFGQVPVGLVVRLKRDLKAAGIPLVDDSGRTLDVHALRHTTATHLAKSGVGVGAREQARSNDVSQAHPHQPGNQRDERYADQTSRVGDPASQPGRDAR